MTKRQFQNKIRKIARREGFSLRFENDQCFLSFGGSSIVGVEIRAAMLAVIQNRWNKYAEQLVANLATQTKTIYTAERIGMSERI